MRPFAQRCLASDAKAGGNRGTTMRRAAGRPGEGSPLSRDRWEYTQLTIPLNLKVESGHYLTTEQLTAIEGLDGIIVGHLKTAAQDGWQPAEPTNWDALASASRF